MFLAKIKQKFVIWLVFALFYLVTLYFALPYLLPAETLANQSLISEPGRGTTGANWLFVFLFLPIFIRYAINILISPWYEAVRLVKRPSATQAVRLPLVSVIIPAWNEEVGIVNTIASVAANHYPYKEIIVVDDGSTDNTQQKVLDYLAKHGQTKNITCLSKANGGKASALNAGLASARGEIIITIDADSYMDQAAIGHFVEAFADPAVMSVAGNVKIGNNHNMLGIIQMVEYLSGFYFKKADSLLGSIYIVGGAAAAYRRQVFAQVGGFAEDTVTEDIEMSTRLQAANLPIAYCSQAIIFTEGPQSLGDLVKQRLRWKWGRFDTFYRYRQLFFSSRANKFLSMLVLPLAFFAEILLFFQPLILAVLFYGMLTSGDYRTFLVAIAVLSAVYCLQVLTDEKGTKAATLLLWAPVIWLFFYVIDFVEYCAQLKCLSKAIRRQPVVWQKWQRVGVFS